MENTSFNFYQETAEKMLYLDDETIGKFFRAVVEERLNGKEDNIFVGSDMMSYSMMKGQLDRASNLSDKNTKNIKKRWDKDKNSEIPNDTGSIPNDTTTIPNDTTTIPNDTTTIPNDTSGIHHNLYHNHNLNHNDNNTLVHSPEENQQENVSSPIGEGVSFNSANSTNNSHNKYAKSFDEFWLVYPRKEDKGNAYKKFKARLKDGYSEDELLTACKNYADKCKQNRTETKYIKLGSTFLSDSMPFADYLPRADTPVDSPQTNPNYAWENDSYDVLSEVNL